MSFVTCRECGMIFRTISACNETCPTCTQKEEKDIESVKKLLEQKPSVNYPRPKGRGLA